MKYTNHFAEGSKDYLQFRPSYPESLFVYLCSLVKSHDTAWDCATGTGQAAVMLAKYFKQVIATDINQPQMDEAPRLTNINYFHCPAEKPHIPDASVDLITVAQALHWFDFTRFYIEVNRVLKPDGIIAAWSYSLGYINPEISKIIKDFYKDTLKPAWPKERHYIDEEYQTIPFPFQKISPPDFYIEKEMNLTQLLGYLATWSAVKEYELKNQVNPIDLIRVELTKAWGDPEKIYVMRWPIHLLVGSKK